MEGYPPGDYHFDGEQALSFVRERSSSDDFSRMGRTQLLMVAVAKKAFQPASWPRLPGFLYAAVRAIDTNVPIWQLPRLFFVLIRIPFFGVDSRTISREMVHPFQTSAGAQVLAPNWEEINPLLKEMFGR